MAGGTAICNVLNNTDDDTDYDAIEAKELEAATRDNAHRFDIDSNHKQNSFQELNDNWMTTRANGLRKYRNMRKNLYGY